MHHLPIYLILCKSKRYQYDEYQRIDPNYSGGLDSALEAEVVTKGAWSSNDPDSYPDVLLGSKLKDLAAKNYYNGGEQIYSNSGSIGGVYYNLLRDKIKGAKLIAP